MNIVLYYNHCKMLFALDEQNELSVSGLVIPPSVVKQSKENNRYPMSSYCYFTVNNLGAIIKI